MTVPVDSQLVTDHFTWYINMCCINNYISCLEKKTTKEHKIRHVINLDCLISFSIQSKIQNLNSTYKTRKLTRPELMVATRTPTTMSFLFIHKSLKIVDNIYENFEDFKIDILPIQSDIKAFPIIFPWLSGKKLLNVKFKSFNTFNLKIIHKISVKIVTNLWSSESNQPEEEKFNFFYTQYNTGIK